MVLYTEVLEERQDNLEESLPLKEIRAYWRGSRDKYQVRIARGNWGRGEYGEAVPGTQLEASNSIRVPIERSCDGIVTTSWIVASYCNCTRIYTVKLCTYYRNDILLNMIVNNCVIMVYKDYVLTFYLYKFIYLLFGAIGYEYSTLLFWGERC